MCRLWLRIRGAGTVAIAVSIHLLSGGRCHRDCIPAIRASRRGGRLCACRCHGQKEDLEINY